MKWANAPKILDDILHTYLELLSIDHPADCATEQLGGLMHSGRAMEKRTFMSLRGAFWTETSLLEKYSKGGPRQLSADSLSKACWAYATALAWRIQKGIPELPKGIQSRTPSPPPTVVRPAQRDTGAWRPRDDAARRTMASKGGISKAGGGAWGNKSEGRRKSGGFMQKGNWRSVEAVK
ncbi:uncharacterized protein RCC_06083 [Ramularia collo-cygni]|uniref:Uncharacterized protein n=1 Tax=Ramularia collo-cygni TaxID=112498 RepID=A0A2D3V9A8_9PEZI|nr:uncharacterized protein RCC_06083 [Ramularia collo-cygni]CZT20226.1 uncharacterized protein RCC_06083 [Ramularia collo-cygni]